MILHYMVYNCKTIPHSHMGNIDLDPMAEDGEIIEALQDRDYLPKGFGYLEIYSHDCKTLYVTNEHDVDVLRLEASSLGSEQIA